MEWKQVDARGIGDGERISRALKAHLEKAARKADFGDADRVTLTARIVEYRWEDRGDVVRLSCTVVGRVVGSASARSRIAFGGSPKDRGALEKQVLSMVANGLVTRLAQIASRADAG